MARSSDPHAQRLARGRALRRLREQARISQERLALISGVGYRTVARAEATAGVSEQTLDRLEDALRNFLLSESARMRRVALEGS